MKGQKPWQGYKNEIWDRLGKPKYRDNNLDDIQEEQEEEIIDSKEE